MAVSGGVAAGAIVAPSLDLAIGVKLALVLALVMVPIAIADLALFKVHRRESTGLKTPEQSLNEQDLARVLVKCAGFYGTLLCIACLYWAFPLYDSEYYKPFFELLAIGAPPILICAPFFSGLSTGAWWRREMGIGMRACCFWQSGGTSILANSASMRWGG